MALVTIREAGPSCWASGTGWRGGCPEQGRRVGVREEGRGYTPVGPLTPGSFTREGGLEDPQEAKDVPLDEPACGRSSRGMTVG